MSTIRKDKLLREPQVGFLICYNPPRYKGLVIGRVVSFTKVGLPIAVPLEDWEEYQMDLLVPDGYETQEDCMLAYGYAPKTGFVIVEDTLNLY